MFLSLLSQALPCRFGNAFPIWGGKEMAEKVNISVNRGPCISAYHSWLHGVVKSRGETVRLGLSLGNFRPHPGEPLSLPCGHKHFWKLSERVSGFPKGLVVISRRLCMLGFRWNHCKDRGMTMDKTSLYIPLPVSAPQGTKRSPQGGQGREILRKSCSRNV